MLLHVPHSLDSPPVKMRMRSVASIMKITKAMKMVSAAKLRAVQKLLPAARAFKVCI